MPVSTLTLDKNHGCGKMFLRRHRCKARRRSLKTSIKKSPPSVAEEQLHAAPEDPFHPAEAGPSITLISNIKPPLVLKTSNS
uniref:Uncharacterized protein n=1 Tax=Ditylenchus dipsaci TaxID=166011 RepID=A0A915DM24_9BILA